MWHIIVRRYISNYSLTRKTEKRRRRRETDEDEAPVVNNVTTLHRSRCLLSVAALRRVVEGDWYGADDGDGDGVDGHVTIG